jgi:hypothetical protein
VTEDARTIGGVTGLRDRDGTYGRESARRVKCLGIRHLGLYVSRILKGRKPGTPRSQARAERQDEKGSMSKAARYAPFACSGGDGQPGAPFTEL